MKRNRYIVAFVILAFFIYLALALPHSRVTKAHFDRIRSNATRAEVERLLGDPSAPPEKSWKMFPLIPFPPELPMGSMRVIWGGYEGVAVIDFNGNSITTFKGWYPAPK